MAVTGVLKIEPKDVRTFKSFVHVMFTDIPLTRMDVEGKKIVRQKELDMMKQCLSTVALVSLMRS